MYWLISTVPAQYEGYPATVVAIEDDLSKLEDIGQSYTGICESLDIVEAPQRGTIIDFDSLKHIKHIRSQGV